jgi:hypothetical protein
MPEKDKGITVTPKVTEVIPQQDKVNIDRRRNYFRHHLDDTQLREVLKYPYDFEIESQRVPINRRSQ